MNAMSLFWIELIPACFVAVVVGTVAARVLQHRGGALVVSFLSTYAVVNSLYFVGGPEYYSLKFLLLFFLLPSLLAGLLTLVIMAVLGPRRGKVGLFVGALIAVCCLGLWYWLEARPTRQAAETAERFLQAVSRQDGRAAYGMLSPAYREHNLTAEQRASKELKLPMFDAKPLAQHGHVFNSKPIAGSVSVRRGSPGYGGPTGISGDVHNESGGIYQFSLIMAKDLETGSWQVDQLSFGEVAHLLDGEGPAKP